jgi:ubiquinone/menaquinone biosynthesis C-methylase UbiE
MTVNQNCVESKHHICANCGKRLFAWLMASTSSEYDKIVGNRKRELFAHLQGKVLEIGPGTGPNLAYYPKDIQWIGIEPNSFMHSYLQAEAEKQSLNIDLRTGTAEKINVEDNSVDTVISTLVLCSVPNLTATLQEILRVLKPGGRFLFIEHVAASPGTWLRTVQNTVRPVWQVIGDGCQTNRETWKALENAGFSNVDYEHCQTPLPIVSPHIIGVATK